MFGRVAIQKNLRKMYTVKSAFTKVFPGVITGTRGMQYKYYFIYLSIYFLNGSKWISFMNE